MIHALLVLFIAILHCKRFVAIILSSLNVKNKFSREKIMLKESENKKKKKAARKSFIEQKRMNMKHNVEYGYEVYFRPLSRVCAYTCTSTCVCVQICI